MNDPQFLATWAAIGVTAVIGSVGWILAAKANRELERTHRLARRASKMANSAHQTATTALRKAAETGPQG